MTNSRLDWYLIDETGQIMQAGNCIYEAGTGKRYMIYNVPTAENTISSPAGTINVKEFPIHPTERVGTSFPIVRRRLVDFNLRWKMMRTGSARRVG